MTPWLGRATARAERMKCHQLEIAAAGVFRPDAGWEWQHDLACAGGHEQLLEAVQANPELVEILAREVVSDQRAPGHDVHPAARAVGHHQPELREAAVVPHQLGVPLAGQRERHRDVGRRSGDPFQHDALGRELVDEETLRHTVRHVDDVLHPRRRSSCWMEREVGAELA
jgi:hypothetical protein